MSYRSEPAGVVEGELGEGLLNLPRDYRQARELTRARLKFTLTGPHMLAKVLLDRHYRDRASLAHALAGVLAAQVAEIDADVVQIDEANITGAPEEALWAAEAINQVLDAVPGETAIHLCFGNYAGQTVQRGTWKALIGFMNRLRVGHVVLEMARRSGESELEALRDLRPEIGIGLGVVDIKDNEVEAPDEIARQIERAVQILGAGRIRYIHPDCGFWMLKRSVADAKMRALVQGRDRFEGQGRS